VVRVLDREDVRRLVGLADAIAVVRRAFTAADQDAGPDLPLGEC
jgi:hypothetical protein